MCVCVSVREKGREKERRTSRRVQGNKKSGRKRRHLVIVIRNLVEIKKFKLKRKKEEIH